MKFMTLWPLLLHIFHFVLPAVFVAFVMPIMGGWIINSGKVWHFRKRIAVHAICGVGVLLAGLMIQGHDGKMGTYVVLIVLAATVECIMHRE